MSSTIVTAPATAVSARPGLLRRGMPSLQHVERLLARTLALTVLAMTALAFSPIAALADEWCSGC
jgi:hypothetical protein